MSKIPPEIAVSTQGNMAMKSNEGSRSKDAFLDWATVGLVDSLRASVRDALHSIATTGECKRDDEEWVLFGEVTELVGNDPLRVQVRRTSMLLNDEVTENEWSRFDLLCPMKHHRVDLSAGMWVGMLVKPCHRLQAGQILADASVPLWNLPQHDKHLAWNASHLFSGAYEGWLRAMWWLQQANLGYSFATHTSVDWSADVLMSWSFNHGHKVRQIPIGADYNPQETFTGIHADISEVTLLRATSHKSNLVMTLSPPCPSWSRGGRHSGLATDEGFCFLDATQHITRVRPLLAIFECSDGIEAHPPFLLHFNWAGTRRSGLKMWPFIN